MRRWGFCLSALLLTVALMCPVANALVMYGGDSVIFEFKELALVPYPLPYWPHVGYDSRYLGDVFRPGDGIRVEFLDELTDAPVLLTDYFWPPTTEPSGNVTGLGGSVFNVPFTDLDGYLRLTMLSGSANLVSLTLEMVNETSFYRQTLEFAPPCPVPEPSTLLLLASGLAGLGGMAWRRHRRG